MSLLFSVKKEAKLGTRKKQNINKSSSSRPLYLLNIISKLYEDIVEEKFNKQIYYRRTMAGFKANLILRKPVLQ